MQDDADQPLPVESGLTSGGLTSGGLRTGHLDDRSGQSVEEAEAQAFGEDLAGKRGITGMAGAIRQIAHETFERGISNLRIQGDTEIAVRGRGLNWQISQQPIPQQAQAQAGPIATATSMPNLYVTNGDTDGYVRVTWGTICGMQPTAMTAGDRVPLQFQISGDAYIYATATINPVTLQWVSANVIKSSGTKQATETIAYELLGTVTYNGPGDISIASWAGGDVTFDPCTDLVP